MKTARRAGFEEESKKEEGKREEEGERERACTVIKPFSNED